MSLHLPPPACVADIVNDSDSDSVSSSDSEDENDQTWDDWVSDSNEQQETKSLFDETVLPSVERALAYDSETHHFNLDDFCKNLSLDFHGRVRLINYIRKTKASPSEALKLEGKEPWFQSDEYLVPVVENDPLIQAYALDWSDSDDDADKDPMKMDPNQKVKLLEKKLALARQSLLDYRALIAEKLNISKQVTNVEDLSSKLEAIPKTRDDDTHYFESYGSNELYASTYADIHAIMINDKVRTSTYAHFILTNPSLFRDAIVLDVGCGTGILSMFAARAGAKRVIAVDASDIALKAEKNVIANGFQDVITVIRGKVESISLPEGIDKVDIIISEWMGYALLYESMLDSVLVARDRFLKPEGVMAPSQCKMEFGLCDASEIHKERIGFWDDVYGFDMSAMATDLYDEAIVDVVGPETLMSEPYTIKDLNIGTITSRELDFTSTFSLTSTAQRRTKINSFILYFDTFFTAHGGPVPPDTQVKLVKEGEPVLAELWPVGGKSALQRRQSMGKEKEKITSFSTGPLSVPTHWKQTIFMLREPITVTEGSIVIGTFMCKKSTTNSREMDVEIHYSVKQDAQSSPGPTTVQMYKVR
ncbi:Ribosomal protein arginine N-methyltransferase rmt3 [Psilocybe cubensis]|uniref:Ribosomal protein arginine N-methyltransferase rmt3 n=2 Tax=Psilocybe cubensis TaxID=181762 RepID=A0ACB8GZ71_PSICU|nr:Ribosomal protein arginine N-methyltransferase rmt3 [Psilocybe cubensis]KAH9480672.1 Ribosomal protein arginine N-methyltransferase rmt3 [Psilocybe cubensis]